MNDIHVRMRITDAVRKDILSGNNTYIKDGWLHFNSITVTGRHIALANNGIDVAVIYLPYMDFSLGDTVKIELEDGATKIILKGD